MVSLDGSPCVHWGSQDEIVPPYTLGDFSREIDEACNAAWENGRHEIATIQIPNGLFPDLAEYRNPVTRSIIQVRHVSMLNTGICVYAVPPYDYSDWTIN